MVRYMTKKHCICGSPRARTPEICAPSRVVCNPAGGRKTRTAALSALFLDGWNTKVVDLPRHFLSPDPARGRLELYPRHRNFFDSYPVCPADRRYRECGYLGGCPRRADRVT